MLAIAIKSTGGLLIKDLPKQLSPDLREQTESLQLTLRGSGLIDADIVVVCRKSQAQIARVPSVNVLRSMSEQGVRCVCGRAIADEGVEEALTISELGRSLLDGNRWLTLLLVHELEDVGVARDRILIDQHIGADELDCLAEISGELAFFELKDKDFNLGNAYSFGAKIGILRPDHAVVFTTHKVGGDAREHFQRSRAARKNTEWDDFESDEQTPDIKYVEGMEHLREGVRSLAGSVYLNDARKLLGRVLPLAILEAKQLLDAIDEKIGEELTLK